MAVDMKTSYSEERKEKIRKVIQIEMMSSENEEEDGFSVRPLPWRSSKCDEIFEQLDQKLRSIKSARSKRQTLKRKIGEISRRPRPTGVKEDCLWALRKT